MKIYLIGMPGSGKTTLGKQLASSLASDFIDLDEEIEKRERKSIPEIFSQSGEDYFRQVESEVLHQWAAGKASFVMATGGGAPCFYEGIKVINDTGLSIFLDTAVSQLVERLAEKAGRPLLKSQNAEELKIKLEQLRSTRLTCYRKAQITIANPTIDLLLEKLRFKK